ncbi:MAG: hypothetical protein V7L00_18130 [Nostoc sp.]|uniref:hypothetical protein n=1 Tax=Nostoc sp. TaxID=1180 RepID=UPI002FF81DC3
MFRAVCSNFRLKSNNFRLDVWVFGAVCSNFRLDVWVFGAVCSNFRLDVWVFGAVCSSFRLDVWVFRAVCSGFCLDLIRNRLALNYQGFVGLSDRSTQPTILNP